MRLGEILLFLTPFALYLLWRVAALRAPVLMVWVAGGAVALIAAAIWWYGLQRSLPHGAPYAPAQMQGGRIIAGGPGRGVP